MITKRLSLHQVYHNNNGENQVYHNNNGDNCIKSIAPAIGWSLQASQLQVDDFDKNHCCKLKLIATIIERGE